MKPEQLLILVARIRDKFNRHLLREFKRNGIEELSPSHGDILFVLASRKRATMRELAHHIDRDKSTLTSLINKLEAGGYVVRTKDKNDSRITYIEATQNARRIKTLMFSISRKLLRETYKDFSEEEKRKLIELLEKLLSTIPAE
ncbi:MAG: MarR family transcriptional regulator [Leptospirales bacterium]